VEICEKFCVLRLGASWFALPATSVREVGPRPSLVPVPGCSSILAGLCHLRNEFLTVLRLAAALGEEDLGESGENQLLVMAGTGGSWALLVDQVVALESLEVAMNSEGSAGRSPLVMGSANYRDHVVRILNPSGLFALADGLLQEDVREFQGLSCS
jgi:chemotaxis signal transduction protein